MWKCDHVEHHRHLYLSIFTCHYGGIFEIPILYEIPVMEKYLNYGIQSIYFVKSKKRREVLLSF